MEDVADVVRLEAALAADEAAVLAREEDRRFVHSA